MANIRKRSTAKSTVYDVRFRVEGRFHTKTHPTLAWAKIHKAEVEHGLAQGTQVTVRRQTFAQFAEGWLATYQARPATRKKLQSHLATHLLPFFGRQLLSQISERDLQMFVQHLVDQGKAPSTVASVVATVTVILNEAVTVGAISKSPKPARLRLPHDDAKEIVPLTLTEVVRLAEAIDPRYRALVIVLAYTGLRWSEAAGLRLRRLDLARNRLTVAETFNDGTFAPTKTRSSRRTIGITAGTVDVLREHLLAHRPDIGPGDLVFTAPLGGGLNNDTFRQRFWLPAVAKAGLDRVTPHHLRHTHVAWLIQHGRHVKEIQARLGHASIRMTLDRYGHLMPGMDDSWLDALDPMSGVIFESFDLGPLADIASDLVGDSGVEPLASTVSR